MPHMSGSTLAQLVRRRRPDVAVLLMSGYTTEPHVHDRDDADTLPFLRKPFTESSLLASVSDALAHHAGPSAS